jgi:hypothetical protein
LSLVLSVLLLSFELPYLHSAKSPSVSLRIHHQIRNLRFIFYHLSSLHLPSNKTSLFFCHHHPPLHQLLLAAGVRGFPDWPRHLLPAKSASCSSAPFRSVEFTAMASDQEACRAMCNEA